MLLAGAAEAQEDSVRRLREAPKGAEHWLPALSVFLPGLGQFKQGAAGSGLGFTTAGIAGLAVSASGDAEEAARDEPRTWDGQRSDMGLSLYLGAGELSAYDSFRRSVPALKRKGRYQFLPDAESVGSLMTAPFDVRFLGRWTTWIDVAHTALVTGLLIADRTKPGKLYDPYSFHDGVYGTSVAYQVGVGEEAMFRGWLFPYLHQAVGERFWLSNSMQAGFFGALHAGSAGVFALDITAQAWYEGWLVRRNHWGIRESIFHHVWYDVAVIAATLATQGVPRAPLVLRGPTIRFSTGGL